MNWARRPHEGKLAKELPARVPKGCLVCQVPFEKVKVWVAGIETTSTLR